MSVRTLFVFVLLPDSDAEMLGFASVPELSFEVLCYNKNGISNGKTYLHTLF